MPTSLDATRRLGRLTADEHAVLDRALRTLRSELRGFLAALPVEAQNASGLARLLHTERTTCQRVVAAITRPYPGVSLASALPGSRGVLGLIDAARRQDAGPSRDELDTLTVAVRDYDRVVRSLAGSRSKLLQRIDRHKSGSQSSSRDGDEATRKALFEAAAAATGRHSDLWLAAHVYEPVPDRPDQLVQSRAHGLVGHRATHDAVPLTFHVFTPSKDEPVADATPGRYLPLVGGAPEGTPDSLLAEFSSSPTPIVRARKPGEFIVQTIEASPDDHDDRGADMLFGLTGGMARPVATEEVWALVNFPTRRLLMDVFLHRDLATSCIPSLDTHLWRPDFAEQSGERWQTRFANPPRLELLGRGEDRARTDAWHRYTELTSLIFETRGLDPDEFVGFRCDVTYPMWRTGYCMSFDFAKPDA